MSQPSNTKVLVVGAISFIFGVAVGVIIENLRQEGDHGPELPCPTCRIDRYDTLGVESQEGTFCVLRGQIDPNWPKQMSPLNLPVLFPSDLNPGDCFESERFACPARGALVTLATFDHSPTESHFANPVCDKEGCIKSNCTEKSPSENPR